MKDIIDRAQILKKNYGDALDKSSLKPKAPCQHYQVELFFP